MADEEENESSKAEDPFEVDCTKKFPTKNLRNTIKAEEKQLLYLLTDLCALGEDVYQGEA